MLLPLSAHEKARAQLTPINRQFYRSARDRRARCGTAGRRTLIQFNQFSLDEFQRQNLVYLKGIVSMTIGMSFEDLFQRIGTKVGSAARVRVKKHLP